MTASARNSLLDSATTALSRRSFLAGSAATAGLLALGVRDAGAWASEAADVSASADAAVSSAADGETGGAGAEDEYVVNATYDADTSEGTTGGTFSYFITNPVSIEPFEATEVQGDAVRNNIFDTLLTWDYSTKKTAPLAAESYEVSEDATTFTFHLRKGATFHNGKPVTAADFVYSWNRIVDPNFKPSPSSVGYKISQVDGYDEVLAGTATELNLEAPDDYTFVVHLKSPFADFDTVVVESSLAPVPAGSTDTEEDFQAFAVHPIGNGPFQMDGDWVDGQYINVKRYEDYWGEKPLIDGINFQIFKDDTTAWTEFTAGNLDFTTIPTGQVQASIAQYGEAEKDGYVASPGHQVFNGDVTAIFQILCNTRDEVLGNADLRRAISVSINRQAICDTVFEGTRSPADNFLMPAVPGYDDFKWDFCPAEADLELADELFTKAGYPLDANGSRNLSITLSTNAGSANETIMTMIQADLAQVGVDATIDVQEWAAFMDITHSFGYQVARMGWTITVPQAYNILHDLFYTDAGNNMVGYANPEFDAAIDKAVSVVDYEERVAAFVEANKIVAADFPDIPLLFYRQGYVASDRVHNLYLTPAQALRLTRVWLD